MSITKKLIIAIIVFLIVAVSFYALNPLINRFQDNSELNEINTAFSLANALARENFVKDDSTTENLNRVKDAIETNQEFAGLIHPHTKKGYEIILTGQIPTVRNPNGDSFISYSELISGALYLVDGQCSLRSDDNDGHISLIYSAELRRVGERKGRCIEL